MSNHRPERRPDPPSPTPPRDPSPSIVFLATLALVAVVVLLALLVTPARAAMRTLSGEYKVGSADRVELAIPFGEVRVEGVAGGPVRVRVEATCDGDRHCGEYLEGLRLEGTSRGGKLQIKLHGPELHAGWSFDSDEDRKSRGWRHRREDADERDSDLRIVVQVPRSLEVELNLGAGEVEVSGLSEDLSIDMGAGEIDVRMPEHAVGSVDVNLAIGETMIHQGGKTREFTRVLGGPIRWRDGRGSADIQVNLGAGEVEVTLE